MNGSIHQLVTLALAAQRALSGDAAAITTAWPNGSTFPLHQWVRFVERPSEEGERVLAADPVEWISILATDRTRSVTIESVPDVKYDLIALVARNRSWSIHTSDRLLRSVWTPEHTLDEAARARRSREPIWRTSYVRRIEHGFHSVDRDVEAATEQLRAAVGAAKAFAAESGARHWVEIAFDPSIRALDGAVFESAMAALVVSDEARLLMTAAERAWVFGGVGSWNDGLPGRATDKATFERITEGLYLAVERAIVVSVNASDLNGAPTS